MQMRLLTMTKMKRTCLKMTNASLCFPLFPLNLFHSPSLPPLTPILSPLPFPFVLSISLFLSLSLLDVTNAKNFQSMINNVKVQAIYFDGREGFLERCSHEVHWNSKMTQLFSKRTLLFYKSHLHPEESGSVLLETEGHCFGDEG